MDGQTWNSSRDVDGTREERKEKVKSLCVCVSLSLCFRYSQHTESSSRRETHTQPLRYHMEVDGVVSIDPNVLPIVVVVVPAAGAATRRMYAITFTSLSLSTLLLQLLLSVSVRRSGLSLSLVCPFFLCAFKVPYYAIRLRGSGPRSLLPAKRVMETSFFFSF